MHLLRINPSSTYGLEIICSACVRLKTIQRIRRDGRVVEGARLESVFRGNSNEGSNPSLSAIYLSITYTTYLDLACNRVQSFSIERCSTRSCKLRRRRVATAGGTGVVPDWHVQFPLTGYKAGNQRSTASVGKPSRRGALGPFERRSFFSSRAEVTLRAARS